MNALTKRPIVIDRPADKDCPDERPKCVGPLVSRRVAVSESEQSTKCTRDYQYCLILVLPFKRIEHRLPLGIETWPRQERLAHLHLIGVLAWALIDDEGRRRFQTRVLPPTCHPIISNSVATLGTGRDERTGKLNQIKLRWDREVCVGM